MNSLCAPAILYLGFSLTQIIIDTFKGYYNIAFFKSIVAVIFTILLNMLCENGLNVISWLIVFIPFMLMSYITVVLVYVFGLKPSNSNVSADVNYPEMSTNTSNQSSSNNKKVVVVKESNNTDDDNDYVSQSNESFITRQALIL